MEEKNYFEEIMNHLMFYMKHSNSEKESSEYNILKHFIFILGKEDFNQTFKIYFIESEETFDEKFFNFHKSMRQTDLYSDCFKKIEIEKNKFERVNISGNMDMIFWNFIHISNAPYKIFKTFYEEITNS